MLRVRSRSGEYATLNTFIKYRLSQKVAFPLKRFAIISQLSNLFRGTPRICNCILLLIVWVRSFSKRLPSVKFAEEKVLIFLIIREKC